MVDIIFCLFLSAVMYFGNFILNFIPPLLLLSCFDNSSLIKEYQPYFKPFRKVILNPEAMGQFGLGTIVDRKLKETKIKTSKQASCIQSTPPHNKELHVKYESLIKTCFFFCWNKISFTSAKCKKQKSNCQRSVFRVSFMLTQFCRSGHRDLK